MTGTADTTTFYIRDAQGNVLAIYSKKGTESLRWDEQHLYGSSRLGMWRWDTLVPTAAPVVGGATSIYDSLLLGSRAYELSNHLGNVLSSISDKKIGNDSSGIVNYYLAEVLSQNDYYPFGMMMPGRKYSAEGGYRYGFNGKENDNEVKGEGNTYDFGARIYDSRLGRWSSVDPLQQKYPGLSPYNFVANNPLIFVDPDGKRIIITGTQKDRDAFVAKLSKLTGLELELQKDGNIKILSDNKNPMSSNLRDAVFDLLDEKGKKYNNDVIFKLVNGKEGFKSNRHDRTETSSTVLFDNFETGALDLQDLNTAQDDATYASLLGHFIGERAQLPNYKDYIDKLDKEKPYDKKAKTLEIKDDGGVFDNAHLAGKLLQTAVLADFYEINGKRVRLTVPVDIEYKDMKKTGTFKFDFKGIIVAGTVDPQNPSDVKTVGTEVQDPAIKPKR